MNQEFNMKKLTALLLGTVVSIAFTASGAFAASPGSGLAAAPALAMDYLKSDDGRTGGYLGMSLHHGEIDDIRANYNRGAADSTWVLDDGDGGKVAFGFDFGKIRFDWRLGALHSNVASIDGAIKDNEASDDAVVGYTTLNVDLDLYRFELIRRDFGSCRACNINIAVTPYIGAGYGYGGGWMTGKKVSSVSGNVAEPAGHGRAFTYEAGILVNLTDWAGITVGYNHLDIDLKGHETSKPDASIETDMYTVGFRLTY